MGGECWEVSIAITFAAGGRGPRWALLFSKWGEPLGEGTNVVSWGGGVGWGGGQES